ncbi:hypothetical protein PENSPDRAFT_692940 [Peniophora sp. CONT]|nr:hypothetical protein PENSPDRAFT_692940 [Peniophora sp. CONT]
MALIFNTISRVRTYLSVASTVCRGNRTGPTAGLATLRGAREDVVESIGDAARVTKDVALKAENVLGVASRSLRCPSCKQPMSPPYIIEGCHHAFCEGCAQKLWEAPISRLLVACPTCGKLMDSPPAPVEAVTRLLTAVSGILL